MKKALTIFTAIMAPVVIGIFGIGCSEGKSPVAPDNDPLASDSTTVNPLTAVLSPSQYDYIPVGQTLTITCSTSGADNADLSIAWSANCGTFSRADTLVVEWQAPDTCASAQIMIAVSDGHNQTGDTLRFGIVVGGTWINSYNLGTYEDGQDVLRTDGGEYIVLVSHGYVYLTKLAVDGTLIWNQKYGLGGSFWARSVIALPDGGYAIVGGRRILDGSAMLFDFFLLRTDAAGNLLWQKVYEGINTQSAYDVVSTPDGGFLIVGSSDSYIEANKAVAMIRTDPDGNLIWHKSYLGLRGTSMIRTSDGNYAVSGEMGAWCTGSADVFLLQIDVEGNIIRQLIYGGSLGELSFGLVETPSGGFAIAGQAYASATGWDAFLLVTDPEGNLTKRADFGGNGDDLIRGVVNRPQGGFAVAGYTDSFGEGGHDMYLTAFDQSGTLEWTKTFGGSELEEGQGIVVTEDDGFLVVGRTMSFSADLCDLFVVKTDKHGRVWNQPEE